MYDKTAPALSEELNKQGRGASSKGVSDGEEDSESDTDGDNSELVAVSSTSADNTPTTPKAAMKSKTPKKTPTTSLSKTPTTSLPSGMSCCCCCCCETVLLVSCWFFKVGLR